MILTVEHIAQVAHEANRACQHVTGDQVPSMPWYAASDGDRESSAASVREILAGRGAAALHEAWCREKTAAGWVYGPVKDRAARTHPCLVGYGDLPFVQQLKDQLFVAVVEALRPGLGDAHAPVETLNLTVRSMNCLRREGIRTVGELTARTAGELSDIRYFGVKCLVEVEATLAERGLRLAADPE